MSASLFCLPLPTQVQCKLFYILWYWKTGRRNSSMRKGRNVSFANVTVLESSLLRVFIGCYIYLLWELFKIEIKTWPAVLVLSDHYEPLSCPPAWHRVSRSDSWISAMTSGWCGWNVFEKMFSLPWRKLNRCKKKAVRYAPTQLLNNLILKVYFLL